MQIFKNSYFLLKAHTLSLQTNTASVVIEVTSSLHFIFEKCLSDIPTSESLLIISPYFKLKMKFHLEVSAQLSTRLHELFFLRQPIAEVLYAFSSISSPQGIKKTPTQELQCDKIKF